MVRKTCKVCKTKFMNDISDYCPDCETKSNSLWKKQSEQIKEVNGGMIKMGKNIPSSQVIRLIEELEEENEKLYQQIKYYEHRSGAKSAEIEKKL